MSDCFQGGLGGRAGWGEVEIKKRGGDQRGGGLSGLSNVYVWKLQFSAKYFEFYFMHLYAWPSVTNNHTHTHTHTH